MMQTAELRSLSYFFFDQHSLYIQGLAYMYLKDEKILLWVYWKGDIFWFLFSFQDCRWSTITLSDYRTKKVQGENNAYLDSFQ
jgi:hypothetical protein